MTRPERTVGPLPSGEALRAFGVRDEPVLLGGGQRRTWRAGSPPGAGTTRSGSRCRGDYAAVRRPSVEMALRLVARGG